MIPIRFLKTRKNSIICRKLCVMNDYSDLIIFFSGTSKCATLIFLLKDTNTNAFSVIPRVFFSRICISFIICKKLNEWRITTHIIIFFSKSKKCMPPLKFLRKKLIDLQLSFITHSVFLYMRPPTGFWKVRVPGLKRLHFFFKEKGTKWRVASKLLFFVRRTK